MLRERTCLPILIEEINNVESGESLVKDYLQIHKIVVTDPLDLLALEG